MPEHKSEFQWSFYTNSQELVQEGGSVYLAIDYIKIAKDKYVLYKKNARVGFLKRPEHFVRFRK